MLMEAADKLLARALLGAASFDEASRLPLPGLPLPELDALLSSTDAG